MNNKRNANRNTKAGSKKTDDPRLFGEILDQFLSQSDSALAAGYRQFVAALKKQQNDNGGKSHCNCKLQQNDNGGKSPCNCKLQQNDNGGKSPCNCKQQQNGNGGKSPWSCDTDMGVDLKTVLLSDERMRTRRWYRGLLCRDRDGVLDEFLCRDPHYTFIELSEGSAQKRNPRVYDGRRITITQGDDGQLRPNFKHLPQLDADITIDDYAFEVMSELRQALKGLVGQVDK